MSKDLKDKKIVRRSSQLTLSDPWKNEDYWANWIGLFLIALGLIIFLPHPPENLKLELAKANQKLALESAPFRTLGWYKASDAKGKLKATNEDYSKTIKRWTHKPHNWDTNPLNAFLLGSEEAFRRKIKMDQRYLQLKGQEEELISRAKDAEAGRLWSFPERLAGALQHAAKGEEDI